MLRGFFGNILIGGSYVYSKELGTKWNGKDIDVFMLIPRKESWALVAELNLIFDSVQTFDVDFRVNTPKAITNKDKYYKIAKQWKRVVCYKNSMMYDLIFVDSDKSDLILNNTGSDISRLYYNVTYNEDNILQLSNYSKAAKLRLEKGICKINYEQCTEAYASKIEKLCDELRLEIRNGR